MGYFYIHPESEFATVLREKKPGNILVNDSKNGYLKIKTPGPISDTIEFGLFRKPNGTPVFLYVENYCGRPACVTSSITAYEYVGGKWKNISDIALPDYELVDDKVYKRVPRTVRFGYQYHVQRYGTTLKIVEGENGKTIYRLKWKNNKFIFVR